MLVYLLIAAVLLQFLWTDGRKKIRWQQIFNDLLPYWEEGDTQDHILGILQLIFIGCISLLKALKTAGWHEGVLVFLFTFISFIWLIKLVVIMGSWLKEYIYRVTIDVVFTILVPVMVFFNLHHLEGRLEIEGCLIALLMSLSTVYIELFKMLLDKQQFSINLQYHHLAKNIKLKSIFTWLGIILINLYTLIVFIQFYWEGETFQFIDAAVFNEKAAIDLLYYLVITFTTVGLGDIRPHTAAAQLVTMLIALTGMFFTGIFVSVILSQDVNNR